MGDFTPDRLDSRSLQTLWEWKNRVLLEEYYIFNVAIPLECQAGVRGAAAARERADRPARRRVPEVRDTEPNKVGSPVAVVLSSACRRFVPNSSFGGMATLRM